MHYFCLTFFLNVQTASGYSEQYFQFPHSKFTPTLKSACWITYLSKIDSRSLFFKCKISSATVLMTWADVPHTRSAGNVRRSSSLRPHVLAMVCSICVPSLCCKGVQVSPTQYTQQGHISARKDEKFVCPLLSWASGSRLEGAFAKKQSNWNCKMLKKYFKLKYFCTTNIAKKGITNGIVCTGFMKTSLICHWSVKQLVPP